MTDPVHGYSVRVDRAEQGWAVLLLRPDGETVSVRACADESEARTFASTVQQHMYWLSPEKFREYYRLPEPA